MRALDREADMGDIGGLDDENRVAAEPAACAPAPSCMMVKTLLSISPLPSNENSMKFR